MPLPAAALAIPAAFELAKGVSGGIGKRRTKKQMEALQDPGAINQEMKDVLASQAQRAQGPDAVLKAQMEAADAAQANQMASATGSLANPNQLISMLSGQGAAMGRQKAALLAQAGQRRMGRQEKFEATKLAMAKQKQARAMDQYDAAMAQGKEDIQEYNKRMWDAGAGIAGLGMKAAMQGVSGLPKLNQAAGPTQMGDAPNMAFGAKHRPAVAQQVAMAPMAQRVALKTNSTTPWDPATPVWMR